MDNEPIADLDMLIKAEKAMREVKDWLVANAGEYAHARQIVEYDSDRRKRLLAEHASPAILAGDSATAADTHARATPTYSVALEELAAQFEAAHKAMAMWEAKRVTFEAARTVAASEREKMKL